MNTVLLVVIAVSLVTIALALVYTGLTAYRLYRQVRQIQGEVEPHVREFTRKQAQTMESLSRLDEHQAEMSKGVERAAASASKLGYLMSEFGEARNKFRGY